VAQNCFTTPRLPPLAPHNLTVTTTGTTTLTAQWDDRSTDEDAFHVWYWEEKSPCCGPPTLIVPAHPGTGRVAVTLAGLKPATRYCVMVKAAYQGLRSLSPPHDCRSTDTPPPPPAPTGLTVTAKSQITLELHWTDNATNETGYRVERIDNGTVVKLAALPANTTTYSDTGLAAGTMRCYRVVAVNAGGESPGATACGTTLPLRGVKMANIWNCASSELSGSLYIFDHTTGAGWTKVAPLPSSWVSTRVGKSCGPSVTPDKPAASVNLPDGHFVTLSAVIVDGTYCKSEDPHSANCRVWEQGLFFGDAAGLTINLMV
jgi:Fibronectin type III domain